MIAQKHLVSQARTPLRIALAQRSLAGNRGRRPCQCQCSAVSRRQALLAATLIGASRLVSPTPLAGAQEQQTDGQQAPPPEAQQQQQQQPVDTQPAPSASQPAVGPSEGKVAPSSSSKVLLTQEELTQEAAKKLQEEEEARKARRWSFRGRLRELEEVRGELAEKELALLEKEAELLEKEQTLAVLREELELERKLRDLLGREKEKAEEEAALAMGLCAGGAMLP